MTQWEKLVVSAYTGVLMTDFDEFHKYVEKIMKRPVFTHEMGNPEFYAELKARTQEDFLKICEEEDDIFV